MAGTKEQGDKKDNRTFAAIGYTPEELKAHIERQFTGGMSWDNYGEWHVDHIRPLSGFDFTSMECEAFKEAWSLANLQPLWAIENLEKAAKQTVLV